MEQTKNPAPRMPVEMSVEFRRSYARSPVSGKVKNISLTGAYISVNSGLVSKGDKLNITISVSGRTRKIAAKVVWTSTGGAGVAFNHFNNRDIQLIDDLMYFAENDRSSRRDVLEDILKKVV